MASITVRNLSAESRERLRKRARLCGMSLESFVRDLLEVSIAQSQFPHDLIDLVEPGQDIDPFLEELDQTQKLVEMCSPNGRVR